MNRNGKRRSCLLTILMMVITVLMPNCSDSRNFHDNTAPATRNADNRTDDRDPVVKANDRLPDTAKQPEDPLATADQPVQVAGTNLTYENASIDCEQGVDPADTLTLLLTCYAIVMHEGISQRATTKDASLEVNWQHPNDHNPNVTSSCTEDGLSLYCIISNTIQGEVMTVGMVLTDTATGRQRDTIASQTPPAPDGGSENTIAGTNGSGYKDEPGNINFNTSQPSDINTL